MAGSTSLRPAVLAFLPFTVNDSLQLTILREMRRRHIDVFLAVLEQGSGGYTADAADDFRSDERLIDLRGSKISKSIDLISNIISNHEIGLLLQVGAPSAYRLIPYVKEINPFLKVIDTLYNRTGHSLDHFLYEKCFDAVVVESQDMRDFVVSNTAKSSAQIHVIESGIDLGRFSPMKNRVSKPGQKPFVVGYLGRMSPEKNPLGFVDLAERLHQVIPELRFRIYGEGPMAAQVSARIASSTASNAIVFEGFAESSAAALAEIDVLVVPSKLDGRPNVIMEANGCGVPVIGAPVGGIPELIVPGVNGFVLAPHRHIEISDLLARWLADPIEFAAIRASSRAMAEKRFDRSRMMDAYEAVYRGFLPAAEHTRASGTKS